MVYDNNMRPILNVPIYQNDATKNLSDEDLSKVASETSIKGCFTKGESYNHGVDFSCPMTIPVSCNNCKVSKWNAPRTLKELKKQTIERLRNV